MKKFTKTLRKVVMKALKMGFIVTQSKELDKYFKGDLDGLHVWIEDIPDDEELFNVLHLIGHCIQWNIDPELLELGNKIHVNPSDETVRKLQEYEWEANCYAMQILHDVKVYDLDYWLQKMYVKDMQYLTNFYITGEKTHAINLDVMEKFPIKDYLVPKKIPKFVPRSFGRETRNGIVI